MGKMIRRLRHGFTLVEIMIVVLIIGVLLSIAVPNFIRAREGSRAKSCQSNLKQIQSAKEQWAMDNKVGISATPTMSDLAGSGKYIRSTPVCPSNGTYTPNSMSTDPTCSVGTNGDSDTYNDHTLPS